MACCPPGGTCSSVRSLWSPFLRPGPHVSDASQRGVHLGTRRGRPLHPCVIAAGGDARDAAHHGDGVTGPVLAHEWEPFGGITSVSRANQAAAFAEDLALQLELAVLTPQTVEFLALRRRQAILAAAGKASERARLAPRRSFSRTRTSRTFNSLYRRVISRRRYQQSPKDDRSVRGPAWRPRRPSNRGLNPRRRRHARPRAVEIQRCSPFPLETCCFRSIAKARLSHLEVGRI